MKNIELLKGAFPARYGGRLSSVINITMNEGNKKQFEGEATVGLLSSKLTLEVPILKDRTSLMVSGRSAYLDLFSIPQKISYYNDDKNQLVNYSMLDGNIKIHHSSKNNASISLSHYSGRDKYSDFFKPTKESKYESTVGWGNLTNTLRYNQIINKKLMVEGIIYHTRYRYDRETISEEQVEGEDKVISFTSGSSIEDVSGKIGFKFTLGDHHRVYAVSQYIYHWYAPSVNQFQLKSGPSNETDQNIVRSQGTESALFIEDDWLISDRWSANLGLRQSFFISNANTFSGLEPRLAIRYKVNPDYTFSASYSTMRQYIHLLTSNTVGIPNDIWVPVTGLAPPEKSWITTLGIEKRINNTYRATGELFYKEMNALIDQKEGQNPSLAFDASWDQLIESGGNGQAYGAELFIEKEAGKLTGWLSYTLSWNYRQFEGVNSGNRYPYRYDRRHQISMVGQYPLSDKWTLTGNWVFMTGFAVTAPVAYIFVNSDISSQQHVAVYGDRNNGRMPDYHRLDLSVSRQKTTKRNRIATLSLGIYNLYARRNPLYLQIKHGGRNVPGVGYRRFNEAYGKAYFLLIPSISYSLKF